MSKYLHAFVIRDAVKNLSMSAAKGRYFEFLMLKRTIVISKESSVVFAESSSSYKQAITELGIVDEKTFIDDSENRYINIFDVGDSTKGYRSARFISNGPNSTVGGSPWQAVVQVDDVARPRKISLSVDYLSHIKKFLIKATGYKPSLQAFSIWFCRHKDLETLSSPSETDPISILKVIVQYTIDSFKFIQPEIDILFDETDSYAVSLIPNLKSSFTANTVQKSAMYLPKPLDKTLKAGSVSILRKERDELGAHNKIFYGAPGTGKSRLINDLAGSFSELSRVTFYPDYTYSQFVGGYKPRSLYDKHSAVAGTTGIEVYQTITPITGETPYGRRPVIDYTVIPGPFLSLLALAYNNGDKNYLLIIEEINRANAAAVFGDVFQLLDRDENGISEYAVTLSIELSNWLREQGVATDGNLVVASEDNLRVRLPGNLYIWATMNSADQGVLPLDSAFKRRWSSEYMPLNKGGSVIADWKIKLLGREISWDGLRREINGFLINQSGGGRSLVAEDKLLGPFFMKRQELSDNQAVLNKLLLYLRDDLVRHNANIVFAAGALHFSVIYDEYNTISANYVPGSDSRDKFSQDLNRLFAPMLAERLTTLYTEYTGPTQDAIATTEPDA